MLAIMIFKHLKYGAFALVVKSDKCGVWDAEIYVD